MAAFGKKDAQQLAIVSQMVTDLDFPLTILPVEIRREPDGLALSSRNRYLSPNERATALNLSQALKWGQENASRLGAGDLAAKVRQRLEAVPGIDVDYVALVNPVGFVPITGDFHGSAILALAAKVGSTRLIDNMDVQL